MKTRRFSYRSSYCRGTDNPNHRLTEDQVVEIRRRYAEGTGGYADGPSMEKLGKEFGVTRGAIWRCVRRKSWKHICP